jgi:predicted GTPase
MTAHEHGMPDDSLQAATESAVRQSRATAARLARDVKLVAAKIGETVDPGSDGQLGSGLLDEADEVAAVANSLVELVDRQLELIGTFNIALFGRTGAGKSSLIEALSGGTGGTVSPGENDWTTEVRSVKWSACQLWDTPGIAGWGRTTSRSDLEERARRAVMAADIVLLCFDSQSQQVMEFRKVADWIGAYRKPAVAVLNNRNLRWRFPTKVDRRSVRVQMSRAVAEHAENIRDELLGIGLPGIPIIAIQTKRALFARARAPFEGPETDLCSFRKLREEVGTARLLDWSNLPVLERLVVTAIRTDADQLRLGTLYRNLDGALARADERLRLILLEPALELAEQTERGIEQILAVLGAPDADAADGSREHMAHEDLQLLERAREGRFDVPPVGGAERHAASVVPARLAPLRVAAQSMADDLIDRAIGARRRVSSEEFAAGVFDRSEVERVAVEVWRELQEYLHRRVDLVAGELLADVQVVIAAQASIRGDAGKVLHRVRVGAQMGGIGLSLIGVATTSVPVVLAGIAAAGAAQLAVNWSRRKSHRRQEGALANARADARRAVTSTFDGVRDELLRMFEELVRTARSETLAPAVLGALHHRGVAAATAGRRAAIHQLRQGLPPLTDPTEVLRAAATACERAAGASGPAAVRGLWLGESWCDDPHGLDAGDEPERVQARPRPSPTRRRMRRRLLSVRMGLGGSLPQPGSGRVWLEGVQRRLGADPDAARLLDELRSLGRIEQPNVVVCGNYNSGKSSFVRRLLADAGLELPPELAIGASPMTDTVREFSWEGVTLVDTPGFQSGDDSHAARVRETLADASAVLCLFNPNLMVRDQEELNLLLAGDPDGGVAPKLDRTLFVINRSDDLGLDPVDDPDGFSQLCRRKEVELLQALAATSALRRTAGSVPAEQVFCMASDPYGMVGDDRAITSGRFDRHRSWDGFEQFYAAVEELRRNLAANGVDVAILHGGMRRLGTEIGRARAELVDLDQQIDQLMRLARDLNDRQRTGRALAEELHDQLLRTTDDFLGDLLTRAMTDQDVDRRGAIARRLERFSSDVELAQLVSEWRSRSRDAVVAWERTTATTLRRRVESRAFVEVLPDYDETVELSFLRRQRGGTKAAGAARSARTAARWISRIDDVARRAPRLARAGKMLGAVGGAVDAATMIRELQLEKRQRSERTASIQQLTEIGRRWAAAVANDDEALTRLDTGGAELLDRLTTSKQSLADRQGVAAAMRSRLELYEEAAADARRRVGIQEERTDD